MSADQGSSAVWLRKAGLSEAELDGEQVIWDPDSGQVVRLDRIGCLIWSGLDGHATLDDLADELASTFATPVTVVQRDITALVRRLAAMGLVRRGDEPAPYADGDDPEVEGE